MPKVANVSFDEQPIELTLTSPFVVLMDPLVLDGLRDRCREMEGKPLDQKEVILRSIPGYMRIGVFVIDAFQPGTYKLAASGVEPSDGDGDACDVDSGAVVIVELDRLPDLARVFTWDRYDLALQSPIDDDSAWTQLSSDAGGTYWGLLNSVEGTAFNGDGSYRLSSQALVSARS